MPFGGNMVRRALLAAFVALPLPAFAEVSATFDAAAGSIVIFGLEHDVREALVTGKEALSVSVSQQVSAHTMPVRLREEGGALVVSPRFGLRPDLEYVVALQGRQLPVTAPLLVASEPALVGFSPSQAVLPANTLRLYLTFSEPMARGQLSDAVRLLKGDGTEVASPFLNLETELWDRDQRRATLLLDPGRIKQGVGPNASIGAPLVAGEGYRLLLSDRIRSAAGIPLRTSVSIAFRVGPPERRAIDPRDWQFSAPLADTTTPLSIAFARIMDSGAASRLIRLEDPHGIPVRGEIATDGGGWSLTPDVPWGPGRYRLIVDPELEDIAGNTPGDPFDAGAGTIGTKQTTTILTVDITR